MREFLYAPSPTTVSKYKCPVCDFVYSGYDVVADCCRSHPRIDKVLGYNGVWFRPENVPEDIIVEDSKGRKIVYTFDSILEDNKTEENNDGKND